MHTRITQLYSAETTLSVKHCNSIFSLKFLFITATQSSTHILIFLAVIFINLSTTIPNKCDAIQNLFIRNITYRSRTVKAVGHTSVFLMNHIKRGPFVMKRIELHPS